MIYIGPLLAASGASGPLAPVLLGVGSAFLAFRKIFGGGGPSSDQQATEQFNQYLRNNGIDPGNVGPDDYSRLMQRIGVVGPLITPWGSPLYDLNGQMSPEHPNYASTQDPSGQAGGD